MRVLIVGARQRAPGLLLVRFLSDAGVGEVTFIGHPLADDLTRQSLILRRLGQRGEEEVMNREPSWGLLSYVWDLALTVFFMLRLRRRQDLYVSGGPHFGLLGLLLKRLGAVKQTVLWTHDYHPRRFANPFLNRLYLSLDRLLAERSDWLWDVVPTITDHRLGRGVRLRREPVVIVGDPVDEAEIGCLPAEDVPRGAILFSGSANPAYGFELLLQAMPAVLEREPSASVTVTTYQQFPELLRHRISELGLDERIHLLGFIPDQDEYGRLVQRHRVGLAIYEPRAGSHKRYSDSRVKVYCARGVPVVMTGISPVAAEVERTGAGIVIDYDVRQLTDAIVTLLSDDEFYERSRANALALAREHTSAREFGAAFRAMGVELGEPVTERPAFARGPQR